MERNKYQSVDRLAALVRILSYEWEDARALMAQLDYPENDDSARRAFLRDIAALVELGFIVEKGGTWKTPAYRLIGHKKWPHAGAMEKAMRYDPDMNVRRA